MHLEKRLSINISKNSRIKLQLKSHWYAESSLSSWTIMVIYFLSMSVISWTKLCHLYVWTNLCCHSRVIFCQWFFVKCPCCIPSFLHLIVFFILIFVGVALSFLPFKYPHLILMSLQRSSARPRYKMETSTSMISLFLSTDFMFILTNQSLCVYNICRCTIQILIWKEMYVWTFCVKIGSLSWISTPSYMAWICFSQWV